MKKVFFLMLCVLIVWACTMPETKIYSIHLSFSPPSQQKEPAEEHRHTPDAKKSLVILVDSPKHLSQAYIVYRSSPYQLEISKYSKWVSTPSETLRDALKEYISSTGMLKEVRGSAIVREEFYSLEIHLKKFEQFQEEQNSFGDILFDVKLISPQGVEISHGTFSKHVKLDDRTFLSLAKGISSALSETVKEVSDRIVLPLTQ
jgi:ABC-type uncharacterized transport system auxiliary subunit